jgi:thioredoxin reductase (NADPH)
MNSEPLDCAVIGGGPAGLTAAIYLSRFHLNVLVIDAGDSRAALIPKTRNHAGFPDGISGPDLLSRMREQAGRYGVRILTEKVSAIDISDGLFRAETSIGSLLARSVLLATGVVNNRPAMPTQMHDEALAKGLLRYCPICDGFEITDRTVGVIGTGERGEREALFLRSYTADVTLIAPDGAHALEAGQRAALEHANVSLVDGPAHYEIRGDQIHVRTAKDDLTFTSIYPALGSVIRSELAVALGAEASPDGCLAVDSHQRTTVKGLYAAGDVVIGLDQISHAMGEGGVAATTIRNDLAGEQPLYR